MLINRSFASAVRVCLIKWKWLNLLGIIGILWIQGCGKNNLPEIVIQRKIAPELKLLWVKTPKDETNKHKIFDLENYKGQWVIIHLWATWNPSSIRQLPQMIQIQNILKEEGVQVIGISVEDESVGGVAAFLERAGVTYPVASCRRKDLPGILGEIETIPTIWLIDPEGYVVNRYSGNFDDKTVIDELKLRAKTWPVTEK